MSFQPKPPTNPLDALMRDAAKQMQKKMGEWQASQSRSGGGAPDAAGEASEEKRRQADAGRNDGSTPQAPRAGGGGSSGGSSGSGGASGGGGGSKKSALGETSAQKFFKWIIGFGIALFILGLIKDLIKGVYRFNEGKNQVLQGVQGFNWESVMGSIFSSLVPVAIFVVAIIFVVKAIRVVPQ